MERDDADLVRACRAGDPDAWEVLVRRYQRLIYHIPRRAGLDEDLAAEVFQRVFTILVEKLDSLAQPERIRSWLVTTARRECWAINRRERQTLSLPQPSQEGDDGLELVDPGLLPGEALERIERQHQIRQAMAALDDRCRQLLSMLFFQAEPPPYAEIAAALGTSAGSIGPTRARCLEKLRTIADQSGIA
jgi:RNA polymerase sigma factor (sigma-70 family)